ncbi:RNA polymerase sigma-70 factor, ECF subfamily [Nocardioides scoriae]|uniref:RNA polymerase sigma-70 factor, ECF subfamily n=1 Tax=Nocardioides scoriae TaxID=642780 RepID=A0A1H1TUA0_9ACTN|nr:sigma-70 family RNA polymerase sigma factor [Nocardioides scoriae]SDS63734.1 RNA polymerase sigma-70 factor, ECF subfamily [Nocardioides scoriae]
MHATAVEAGLDALRRAVLEVLLSLADGPADGAGPGRPGGTGTPIAPDDHDQAASSAQDEAEQTRLIALVELARGGDSEAFGQLYDHYQPSVFRFLYYRVGSVQLAEDLTSDTFFRALRAMSSFRWQGKDFGAWLMTIARNLTMDHYKAGRTRLEQTTEDMNTLDTSTEGPETSVLASLTHEALLTALTELPTEQRECLVMRFLQGLSIAETAEVLGRSAGAVKQLQLRGVRNLAKALPEDLR